MNAKPLGGLPQRGIGEFSVIRRLVSCPETRAEENDRERELREALLGFAVAAYSGDEAQLSAALGALLRFAGRAEVLCEALTDLVDKAQVVAVAGLGLPIEHALDSIKKLIAAQNKVLGLLGVERDM